MGPPYRTVTPAIYGQCDPRESGGGRFFFIGHSEFANFPLARQGSFSVSFSLLNEVVMNRSRIASTAILLSLALGAGWSFLPQQEIVTEIVSPEPPERLWSVLVDRASYPDWNPLIVRSEGPLVEGERIRNTMTPGQGEAEGEEIDFEPLVLVVRANEELRWRGRFILPGVLDGEHYFLLEEIDGGARVVHGEIFSGVALWFIDAEQFRGKFERFNLALLERAERAAATHERL